MASLDMPIDEAEEEPQDGQEEWLSELTDDDYNNSTSFNEIQQENSTEVIQDDDNSTCSESVLEAVLSKQKKGTTTESNEKDMENATIEDRLNTMDGLNDSIENELDKFLIRKDKTGGKATNIATGKEEDKDSDIDKSIMSENDGNDTDDLLRMLEDKIESDHDKSDEDYVINTSKVTTLKVAKNVVIKRKRSTVDENTDASTDEEIPPKRTFVLKTSKGKTSANSSKYRPSVVRKEPRAEQNTFTGKISSSSSNTIIHTELSPTRPKHTEKIVLKSRQATPKPQIKQYTNRRSLLNSKPHENTIRIPIKTSVVDKGQKTTMSGFIRIENNKDISVDRIESNKVYSTNRLEPNKSDTIKKFEPKKSGSVYTKPRIIKKEVTGNRINKTLNKTDLYEKRNDSVIKSQPAKPIPISQPPKTSLKKMVIDKRYIENEDEAEFLDEEALEDEDLDKVEEAQNEHSASEDMDDDYRNLSSENEDDEESYYDDLPSSESEDVDDWFSIDIRSERAADYIQLLGDKAMDILLFEKNNLEKRLSQLKQSLSSIKGSAAEQAEALKNATKELRSVEALLSR